LTAFRLDGRSDPYAFVCLEVVHDHDLPGMELGAITCSTYSAIGCGVGRPDLGIKAAPMPSRESEAMSVMCLPRLRGTLPLARSPFGARAYKGVKAMLEPLSAIHTSDSLGSLLAFARQVAHSSSALAPWP
jgi:hypothetical protein